MGVSMWDAFKHDMKVARRLNNKPADPDNSAIRAQIHSIVGLNFKKQRKKLSRSDSGLGWSKQKLAIAEQQYKCFLYLRLKYGRLPPTETIDEFWHAHILDTEKYFADTALIFGRYEHHYPYRGLEGKRDEKRWLESFRRAQELYEREFGDILYEIDY
jgi:hypothetical protein